MTLACLKGLVAGSVNLAIALLLGAHLPSFGTTATAMFTGFAGYGVSLVLFVVALRNLGTARTSAYFSIAPIFGVVLSLFIWPELPSMNFWIAAALMAAGIWLLFANGISTRTPTSILLTIIHTDTTNTTSICTTSSGTASSLTRTRINI